MRASFLPLLRLFLVILPIQVLLTAEVKAQELEFAISVGAVDSLAETRKDSPVPGHDTRFDWDTGLALRAELLGNLDTRWSVGMLLGYQTAAFQLAPVIGGNMTPGYETSQILALAIAQGRISRGWASFLVRGGAGVCQIGGTMPRNIFDLPGRYLAGYLGVAFEVPIATKMSARLGVADVVVDLPRSWGGLSFQPEATLSVVARW
jgi:hypothetical protein